jgi:hypothetical protein
MRRASLCFSLIVLLCASAAFAGDTVPLSNWTVPAASGSLHNLRPSATADLAGPLIFVPVTPCRVVDTRGATGSFGGPSFTAGQTRSYTVPSSSCTGIPTGIAALSLNLSVTNTQAPAIGFLTAWPAGSTQPGAANLTWFAANQTLTAASIVPTASGGAISVFASQATDVIIDVNGYFLGDGNILNTAEHLAIVGTWDGGGLIRGTNLSTNPVLGVSGVRGVVTSAADNISGVNGVSRGSGANFAVSGVNEIGSANSAGVLGVSVSRPLLSASAFDAGVRGENGNGGLGVFGITNSAATPSAAAIVGLIVDSSGNPLANGNLGFRASNSVVYGVFSVGNMGATGTKSFVEPHPTDASKVIRYVALEGPEAGTYFRGRGRFVNGQAVIDVPESFRMVTDTDGLTVQITPIGAQLTTANVVSANLDQITFRGNHDVEFFYLVQGVRKAYRDWQPVAEGTEFVPRSPSDRLPSYLSEEAQRRLIQNGTYNADGSVNMATAVREGWTRAWASRQNAARVVTAPEP